jgi:hypothetical protein
MKNPISSGICWKVSVSHRSVAPECRKAIFARCHGRKDTGELHDCAFRSCGNPRSRTSPPQKDHQESVDFIAEIVAGSRRSRSRGIRNA